MQKIATIGFFDGVHKGHCFLFEHLHQLASEQNLEPLIVTFDTHPRAVLQADYVPQLLTTLEERISLLRPFGEVLVLPFSDIHMLTAEDFMRLLHEQYDVSALLMGYDHRFGADRLRHIQDYRRRGDACSVNVLTMGEFIDGEWHVSSTEIRQALNNGNIAVANELLGRPYSISGKVIHGKAIGRTIGFPTANIEPSDPLKMIPKSGVYMAHVNTPTMDDAPAFVNIDSNRLIEVHIPSFKGNLYDQQLEIRFLRFLREEKHFENLNELREQIKADVDNILRQA